MIFMSMFLAYIFFSKLYPQAAVVVNFHRNIYPYFFMQIVILYVDSLVLSPVDNFISGLTTLIANAG